MSRLEWNMAKRDSYVGRSSFLIGWFCDWSWNGLTDEQECVAHDVYEDKGIGGLRAYVKEALGIKESNSLLRIRYMARRRAIAESRRREVFEVAHFLNYPVSVCHRNLGERCQCGNPSWTVSSDF